MSDELPVTGYFDRFSARPGGSLGVHVSVRDGGRYRARMERVLSGDPNPAGPGMRFEDLSARFDRTIDGRHHPIRLGSYGRAPAPVRDPRAACTWTALLCMAAAREEAAILAEESDGITVTLSAGRHGASAFLTWPGGSAVVATGRPIAPLLWCRVWLAVDPASGRVVLGQTTAGEDPVIAEVTASGIALPSGGTVLMAAECAAAPTRHFTGKLEAPAIFPCVLRDWTDILAAPGDALAAWDFAPGIDGFAITDTGEQARHGTLVNMPTRAVVGARWSGAENCWRHAPEDYAAIHFHDDDLGDCGWDEDFRLAIADDMPSGAYVLRLTCDAGEDRLPFYVLPKREGPHAAIAFLASTFTYQAYANHARGNTDAAFLARMKEWGASPYNPDQFPLYSHSTYNRHPDRSGIALSSRLRPIMTMRPGFLTFNDARGSGMRHYPADTHILAWLDAKGLAFDIVTDEDLDEEGAALLAPYRTVLTGSHPEYHTSRTLDAIAAFTGHGGKLCYLGGNGFYWRIARNLEVPHLIEIRRAEGGIRAWDAQPGEYYNQLDGALGGLWRRNRRPPQQLVGVGFSGQGLFEGTFYRRLPASFTPEFTWMFDGIDAETIGDYGLSGGGAAGFELDRADYALGTPAKAVILARSEDPPDSFVTVPEELLSHLHTVSGEKPDALKRGEIVYFDTPSGGAVFSVGSITFCGSLWGRDGGFTGPVSRLLENVVRRFSGLT